MNALFPIGPRVAVSAFLCLASCSAGNCDASQAGFFSGLSCSANGGYERRENGLRNDLANANASKMDYKSRADQAAAEAQEAEQAVRRQKQLLASVDSRLAVLRRQLDAAQRTDGTNRAELRRAEHDYAMLRDRRRQLSDHSSDDDVRAFDSATRELSDRLGIGREGL